MSKHIFKKSKNISFVFLIIILNILCHGRIVHKMSKYH